MKKLSLIIALLFCFVVGFTQNDNVEVKKIAKKDYSVFFPKAGDIALGTDATQWIRFIGSETFGRINNNNYEDTPVTGFKSDLFGKYFLSNNLALRARLGFGFNCFTTREFVRDDYQYKQDPFSEQRTVDTWKHKDGAFELGVGAEIRRSLWKLQGYAGAELFVGYGYAINKYEYGNAVTEANPTPSTTNFYDPDFGIYSINPNFAWITTFVPTNYYRLLNTKAINTINYGGSIFAGVDYFFNRNVSLGVEFDLQARAYYTGETKAVAETWKYNEVYTKEIVIRPTQSGFRFHPMGRLNLMFYF